MSLEQIQAMRQQKDEHFGGDNSPLKAEQKAQFSGLTYFEVDLDYRFEVELDRFEESIPVPLPMNNGSDGPMAEKIGTLTVTIAGQAVTFTALKVGDQGYGFHFKDGTNGEATYGAGRFLHLLPQDNDHFLVDFNLAGNLMCAYAVGWTCPVPLPENCVDVLIPVGEKIPTGDWVQH